MELEYVPLLAMERELYALPRGMERFRAYLRTMLTADGDDTRYPPLVMVNPMAKEHVAALLDQLLALDADGLAARAAAEASAALAGAPVRFKAALVVADDAGGGWTSRAATDFALRAALDPFGKRFWITGVLWSSDPASARATREAILAPIFRTAHVLRHGPARTLRDLLAQEGAALAAAGCAGPALDDEELAYTAAAVAPLLDRSDHPTLIACLLGDPAARALGYPPQGLSDSAGLALALHQARVPSG